MADLQSLNFSLTGVEESKEKQAKDRLLADIVVAGLEKKEEPAFVVYKLHKKNGRGKVHVDGRDDVINPNTGRTERIYLLNGVTSIWQSQLGDIIRDKNYISNNIRSLTFDQHGVCRIPSWDTNALEFAQHCRHNIENPNKKTGSKMEFYRYDPSKQEKALLEKEMKEMEMVLAVKDMPEESLKKHASYVGISFLDEHGSKKTEDGVRRELMVFAKRNPEAFSKIINTKEIEIAYMIKSAILQSKIDIGSQPGTILWAKGAGLICRLPGGRRPLEYLIELAMDETSQSGKQFLEQLKALK